MRSWLQSGLVAGVLAGCSNQPVMHTYTAPIVLDMLKNRSPMMFEDGSEIVVLRVPAMI